MSATKAKPAKKPEPIETPQELWARLIARGLKELDEGTVSAWNRRTYARLRRRIFGKRSRTKPKR